MAGSEFFEKARASRLDSILPPYLGPSAGPGMKPHVLFGRARLAGLGAVAFPDGMCWQLQCRDAPSQAQGYLLGLQAHRYRLI